jgi:hypothetical protein
VESDDEVGAFAFGRRQGDSEKQRNYKPQSKRLQNSQDEPNIDPFHPTSNPPRSSTLSCFNRCVNGANFFAEDVQGHVGEVVAAE